MTADDFQKVWRTPSNHPAMDFESAALSQVCNCEQQTADRRIRWHEAAWIAAPLAAWLLWIYVGAQLSFPWSWYLVAAALLWQVVLSVGACWRRSPADGFVDQTLLDSARDSLSRLDRDIAANRGFVGWSLLPLAVSLLVFTINDGWLSELSGMSTLAKSVLVVVGMLFLSVIYQLIQRAMTQSLLEQRQDLLQVVGSLEDVGPASGTHIEGPLSADAAVGRERAAQPATGHAVGGWVLTAAVVLLLIWVIRGNATLESSTQLLQSPEFNDVGGFDAKDVERIDEWLQDQVERAKYPSLSVAVVRNGQTVFERSYGMENIRLKREASPNTPYHVASVTKVFVATVATMLHERGIVDLDRPVIEYLPESVRLTTAPEVGRRITLRQLASHTSGLPRSVPGRVQSIEGRYQLEPQLLYDHLARVRLNSEPGTAEEYSNLGFGLLGHALERATGQSLAELVEELICSPLELRHTAIQQDDRLVPATGYGESSWRLESKHSLQGRLAGSGGLIASVNDLSKFLVAQMKPGAFTDTALTQLHTPTQLNDGSSADTALGWSVRSNDFVGRILKKNGGRSNCSAWIGFAPEHGVGVAVVTNCGGPDVDPLGYWLLERSVAGAYRPVTPYGYAKVVPYTGVRWQGDQPIVQVKGDWLRLASINDIPIEQIMQFAQREFGSLAQKRFAEDLVEVLAKMGHDPEWDVELAWRDKDGQLGQATVRMTQSNRSQLRNP